MSETNENGRTFGDGSFTLTAARPEWAHGGTVIVAREGDCRAMVLLPAGVALEMAQYIGDLVGVKLGPVLACGESMVEPSEVENAIAEGLDPGIRDVVMCLRKAGIETFESCQGGPGHAYSQPTVRFHGERGEGFRALAVAMTNGLKVIDLRRTWPINDGEPTGPWWELTFAPTRLPTVATE